MPDYTIYHNPRCSKSREALNMLRDKGIEPTIVEYMKDRLEPKQLELLLMKLDMPAKDLLRKNEAVFKEKFKGYDLNEHEWVKVMSEEPKLIERPIVVRDHKAVVGRPLERVKELMRIRV